MPHNWSFSKSARTIVKNRGDATGVARASLAAKGSRRYSIASPLRNRTGAEKPWLPEKQSL
jgi:hypothetical protein